MGNPARVLHTIYATWRSAAADPKPMSHIINLDTAEGAQALTEAARALVEINDVLTQFERNSSPVGVYRRQYPEWWKPLVSQQAGWGQNLTPDNIIGEGHLDEIESFANFLDGKVWILDQGDHASLRDFISRARSALENDTALSQILREYIHQLLQQIEIALDDERVGATFDYGEAVRRLLVAFKAAESESTSGQKVWTSLWTQIVSGTSAGAIVQGATIALGAIVGAN